MAHRNDCGMPDCFICYGAKTPRPPMEQKPPQTKGERIVAEWKDSREWQGVAALDAAILSAAIDAAIAAAVAAERERVWNLAIQISAIKISGYATETMRRFEAAKESKDGK